MLAEQRGQLEAALGQQAALAATQARMAEAAKKTDAVLATVEVALDTASNRLVASAVVHSQQLSLQETLAEDMHAVSHVQHAHHSAMETYFQVCQACWSRRAA